jgi:hypothetical protein
MRSRTALLGIFVSRILTRAKMFDIREPLTKERKVDCSKSSGSCAEEAGNTEVGRTVFGDFFNTHVCRLCDLYNGTLDCAKSLPRCQAFVIQPGSNSKFRLEDHSHQR